MISPDGSWLAFSAQLPGQATTVLAATDREGGEIRSATGGQTYLAGVHPRFRPVP